MAKKTTSPLRATPSTSTSLALVINSDTTTELFGDIFAAADKNSAKSAELVATFIAEPDKTYDGRTRSGKPIWVIKSSI